jgi:hypothetical protein
MSEKKYTESELNELRLHANEIMMILYGHKSKAQLELLVNFGKMALEHIEQTNGASK